MVSDFRAMAQHKLPAVFMRGGTSKAIMFHARDLPRDRADWDPVFLAAMGSPDPNGRQLDGMGGGVSSLSKVCVVGPPSHPEADVDYTFAQVLVGQAKVDYSGNCGNMSSAIGPFAVDEGLVRPETDDARVRIHNTNTGKIIVANFMIRDGMARTDGSLRIPGVAGAGAPIRLDFPDLGGATTGSLLPTGRPVETLQVDGIGAVEASLVDAANACVFVAASTVGLSGCELPDELDARPDVLARLAAIREAASMAVGITANAVEARQRALTPFVVMVAPPLDATIAGGTLRAGEMDLTARAISSGQPHRALPVTVSLCLAVASRIDGSVVHRMTRPEASMPLRIGMPSGVLTVGADVARVGDGWHAASGMFFRTARRLFDGTVYF